MSYNSSSTECRKTAKKDIYNLHNCMTCVSNCDQIFLLFGPDGYALSFKGDSNSFVNIRAFRKKSKRVSGKVFILNSENIASIPKVSGHDLVTGKLFTHIGLNLEASWETKPEVYGPYSSSLLNNFLSSTMDVKLENMITNFQKKQESGSTFMTTISTSLEDPSLLRKEFWVKKIDVTKEVQAFSSTLKNGSNWELMTPVDKIKVKMFTVTRGNNNSIVGCQNILFKETGHLVDCYRDVSDFSSMSSFMNSRSDPVTYMVRQVAEKIETHNVTSKFKVSLAWNDTSDLDLSVVTNTGEHISFSNKYSRDRKIKLDFDANAGGPTLNPVENITFSDDYSGTYKVYVNNYKTRGKPKSIPYTIVVNLLGKIETFECEWDVTRRRCNSSCSISKMNLVTTVVIDNTMISNSKIPPGMSAAESSRYIAHHPGFVEHFGEVTSNVVDMQLQQHALTFGVSAIYFKPTTSVTGLLGSMAGMAISKPGFMGMVEKMHEVFKLKLRDHPPSYLTRHSCGDKLKTNIIANTYYEKGRAPRHPDKDATMDNCRLDSDWFGYGHSELGTVSGIIPVKGPGYDGYLLSIRGAKLPSGTGDWVVGSGMYPTDLKSDYHIYRDIWQTHHTLTKPVFSGVCGAIGVFLHKGKGYNLEIPGVQDPVFVV